MNPEFQLTKEHQNLIGNTEKYTVIEKFKKKQITKGLLNPIGHNNCFLNVVIQALFHLENFRGKFYELADQHNHAQKGCVFCSLKDIFVLYQFSDEINIAPNALRDTMAFLYKPEMKFQLEKIDDAGEALDAILQTLHKQLIPESEIKKFEYQAVCTCKCVTHSVFGITLSEQVICDSCGHKGDPIPANVFNIYAYTLGILSTANTHPSLNLGQTLKQIDLSERKCSNPECRKMAPVHHFIHNPPTIFSIGIVWDTDQPTTDTIQKLMERIETEILLEDIFSQVFTTNNQPVSSYRLRGMMCYYGQHYSAFFYHTKTKQWFSFDDTSVRPIGCDFQHVREKCVKGKLQPSVLFYEQKLDLVEISNPSRIRSSSGRSKLIVFRADTLEDASKLLSKNRNSPFIPMSPPSNENLFNFPETYPRRFSNPLKYLLEENTKEEILNNNNENKNKNEIENVNDEIKNENDEIKNENDEIKNENEIKNDEIKIDEIKIENDEIKNENDEIKNENLSKDESTKNESANNNNLSKDSSKNEKSSSKSESENLSHNEKSIEDPSKPIEFKTRRTNWMYRQQERIYKVKTSTFERIDPFKNNQVKESFHLGDILKIVVIDSTNCVISFCSAKEDQYINFLKDEKLNLFLKVIEDRAIRFTKTNLSDCIIRKM